MNNAFFGNATGLTSGIVPSLRGTSGSVASARTMNAFAILSAGTRPLRVLGLGDSALATCLQNVIYPLGDAIGLVTYYGDHTFVRLSTTGTDVSCAEFFPSTGTMLELESGEEGIWGADSTHTHVTCDTIRVDYRRSSGAGTFKLQTRADSGSWIDEGSPVVTSNSTVDYSSTTFTLSSLLPRQAKIVSTSGTCNIMQVELTRVTGPGVTYDNYVISGGDMSQYTASTTAVRRGWLQAHAADVIFLRWYEAEISTKIAILQADLLAVGLNTTTDIVVLGVAQTSTAYPDAAQLAQVEERRAGAVALNVAFIDLWHAYNNRFLSDAVHSTQTGSDWLGHEILRQLGWLEILKVKQLSQHFSARTAFTVMADSTTQARDTAVETWLSPGTWNVRGRVIWNADATGQGVDAYLQYIGTTGIYSWVNQSGGPNDTAWLHFFKPAVGDSGPDLYIGSVATTYQNGAIDFEIILLVHSGGRLSYTSAKKATGGTSYWREGSFIQATKIA